MTAATSPCGYDLAVVFRGSEVGGTERHTAELLKYLADTSLRIVLLQSGFDLRSMGVRAIPGRLDIVDSGLGIRRLSRTELRAWSRLLRDHPAPRILLVKPGYLSVDLPFARLLRKAAPTVFHFEHSLAPAITRGPSRRHFGFVPGLGLYWRLEPWRRRRMSRQVDKVFIDSEAGKQALVENTFLAEDQVIACLNGLDVDRWVPDADKAAAFRERYGIPQDAYLFGAAGRIDPLKGIDLALRAFAQLAEGGGDHFRLCVVGEGPSRPEMEELARQLNVEGRVVFTGYVEDISAAYAALDTLLFPSKLESCPLVLLEAMGCGCRRAIASPIGGVPEILRDPACGDLISSRDPGAWADLMRAHLQTPPEQRPALAARIRDYVVTHHDQRRQFQFLAEWFGAAGHAALPPAAGAAAGAAALQEV